MSRVALSVFVVLAVTGCGGDGDHETHKSKGGGAIGSDGGAVDGAIHSAFDSTGDGLLGEDVQSRTGDTVGTVDVPQPPDDLGADSADTATPADGEVCAPDCAGKACGDDGCGGVCGFCPKDFPHCVDGLCADCVPDCTGLACGDDGCGGSCGSCGDEAICVNGACECLPSCTDSDCGMDDGCGGLCPPCVDASVEASPDVPLVDGGSADVPGDTGSEGDSVGPDAEPGDVAQDTAPTEDAPAPDDTQAPDDTTPTEDASADATQDVPPEDVGVDGGVADAPAEDGGPDAADGTADVEEDAGPPPPLPEPGEIVLAEFMRSPLDGATVGRQWFEVVSVATGDRQIGGCAFIDAAGTSWVLPGSIPIAPSERRVFGQEGDIIDGLAVVDGTYPGVADGGPDLSVVGIVTLSCDTGTIDTVDLSAEVAGASFADDAGYAIQLDPSHTHAVANDAPSAWCNSYLFYGAAGYGTPGVPNHVCDSDVDWCRLWVPAFKLVDAGVPWEVTSHLHEEGLTDLTPGAPDSSPTLQAQVGFGPDDTIPSEVVDQWTWFTAVAVEDPPGDVPAADDRYLGTITITEPGVYDYAARFSLDGGYSWTYCDLDGSPNGYSASKAGFATVL